jgi:hypothetical protein
MEKRMSFLKGKKTIAVSILSILLGILNGDTELIMIGLVGLGLRDAIR